VLGFRDRDKWNPVLAPNPDFDAGLQHEGVTCAACHVRNGRIVGVLGIVDAPHPVQQLDNPNEVCVRCHVVEGERWDTFFRFPPCGTVAEIRSSASGASSTAGTSPPSQPDQQQGGTGEISVPDTASLGCVQCHMPLVKRPLVEGGQVRPVRQHLWRGGHDPEMVKSGLQIDFGEVALASPGTRVFALGLTNVGAAHYLPTGIPDRHLTVALRLLDSAGKVLQEQRHRLRRTVIWRPFIIDLWDTRLPRWQSRSYELSVAAHDVQEAAAVEGVVRYHLLDERRRRRIGYENPSPIAYVVFRKKLVLDAIGTGVQ
jgi:hypothetical protein